MWGNEPSHSQVNSHCGSWSPKWTPKFSKRNCRGQNPLIQIVFYIIGNLLKRRCLKWTCMTHLDIRDTSYDQKKGWKSNWQFNSRPLKVRNWPDCLVCGWRATYFWKDLNNFASDLIAIRGLLGKLCAPKVAGILVVGIPGLLGQKTIWMWPLWRATKNIIRGKVVASPKCGPWWVLWVRGCLWLVLAPKMLKLCTYQLCLVCADSRDWIVDCHSS